MDFFDFLSLMGGLALFLYGMELLGEGLSKAAGGQLQKILSKLTDSKIKAVLLGAAVTAIVQSSSATTVMVVGLVNSNIVKLSQSVGVIMGANIGTTATSWILSLSGIQSDNFFIKLLKPSSFSPVIALTGVGMLLFSKNDRKKSIGKILIGFAILMYGMEAMTNSLEPLSQIEEFKNLFIKFENPVLGLLIGIILTSIIQSSSASVGILQAFSMTGMISFAGAIPIIMGQNIGTCITAIISSIGVGKNGKRAALIHLYFNLIGTIIFMTVFYSLNAVLSFTFMEKAITVVDIAIIHSIFNITTTMILFPFSNVLEKLALITLPEDHDESSEERKKIMDNLKRLDDIFLENPSFAMSQCKSVTVFMAELSKKSVKRASKCLWNYSDKLYDHISSVENNIDDLEDALSTYLVKLSTSENIVPEDSKMITKLLKLIGYFERIGDHAFNIAQNAKIMNEKDMSISKFAKKELKIYLEAIKDVCDLAYGSFIGKDLEMAKKVEPLEDVVDDLSEILRTKHIKRLVKKQCSVEVGFFWTDIIADFERISDYCSNIAILVLNMDASEMDMHEYIHSVKRRDSLEFKEKYLEYHSKYAIEE